MNLGPSVVFHIEDVLKWRKIKCFFLNLSSTILDIEVETAWSCFSALCGQSSWSKYVVFCGTLTSLLSGSLDFFPSCIFLYYFLNSKTLDDGFDDNDLEHLLRAQGLAWLYAPMFWSSLTWKMTALWTNGHLSRVWPSDRQKRLNEASSTSGLHDWFSSYGGRCDASTLSDGK